MRNKNTLLSLSNVKKYFPIHKGVFYRHVGDVHAVDGITFDVQEGETIGLVGESGCGKSTLGKTLLHLYKPTGGKVIIQKPDYLAPTPITEYRCAITLEKLNKYFESYVSKRDKDLAEKGETTLELNPSTFHIISNFNPYAGIKYLILNEGVTSEELQKEVSNIDLSVPFSEVSNDDKLTLIVAQDKILQARMKVDIEKLSSRDLRCLRKEMQMIFQDPMEALNSRMPVGTIIEEPFIIHKGEHPFDTPAKRKEEVLRLLNEVGLPESAYYKYPHQFSGGQRQRIGIARAIALKPKLVVCDEPVSALDVSVQSQVLNLMVKLQKELGLTYIFIAHNLSVVKYIADRICVMYLGRIVETAKSEEIYRKPLHPYTQALISAIPEPDPNLDKEKQILEGDVPSPIDPPSGCHFHPRCPFAQSICQEKDPELQEIEDGHSVACHFAGKLHQRSI